MKMYFFLFILLCSQFLQAQKVETEILKEPFLKEIDTTLNKKLGLFAPVLHFKKAILFQKADSSYVLELYYEQNGQQFTIQKPMSSQELAQWRFKLRSKLRLTKKEKPLDQSGRPKLLIASTLMSLGYYGWIVPVAFDVKQNKPFVALYMFTGSAGFIIPYYLTKKIEVTQASASMAIYGLTRGVVHGFFVGHLLNENASFRFSSTSSLLTSITEGTLGYWYATKKHLKTGTVETMAVGGDVGFYLGIQVAQMLNILIDKPREGSSSFLLGSAFGLVGAKWLTNQYYYSRGDARVLEALALLGAFTPYAITDLANIKNDRIISAATATGTLLGMAYAHNLLKNKDFSYNHGLFIELGEIAGGLLATGLAYLLTPNNMDRSKVFLTAGSVGAWSGFLLMYHSFARSATKLNAKWSLNLNFFPAGLLGFSSKHDRRTLAIPIMSARIHF